LIEKSLQREIFFMIHKVKQYLMHFLFTSHFKFNAKKDTYELNIEVNNLTPVERFLRGMDGNL